jgi:hypothetical protein
MTAAVANGQPAPMFETNNVVNHPVGPEFQLLAGEGQSLRSTGFELNLTWG